MAIITLARQVASHGDEIGMLLAKKLGYEFIDKKKLGNKIIELGFSAEQMKKYDEVKPSFFSALAKERDEYFNYLQTAVLDFARKGNCIFIGRGTVAILSEAPNLLAIRLVADNDTRLHRLMTEFSWNEKQAQQRIDESDENRQIFHRIFFNIENENSINYHAIFNTSILSDEIIVDSIKTLVAFNDTDAKNKNSKEKIENLYKAQMLTNYISMEKRLAISFLKITFSDEIVILNGIADSNNIIDLAIDLISEKEPNKNIVSQISITHDCKFRV